jgi:CRP/FNR family transcriptional regulator
MKPPEVLGDLPVWKQAGSRARETLARIVRLRRFPAGGVIVPDTMTFCNVAFIVSGLVRLVKHRVAGDDQILGLLFPSDMFGRLFVRMPPISIEAAAETTLALVDKGAFETLLKQHHELERAILMSVYDELDASYELLTIVGTQSRRARVASFLLYMCRRSVAHGHLPISRPPVLAMPLSRHDIAACLSTTVETISRTVHELERMGAIRIIDARTFELTDGRLLAELAGEEAELVAPCAVPSGA